MKKYRVTGMSCAACSAQVEKAVAKEQCVTLEKQCQSIAVQIKVQIDKILEKSYK